MSTWASRLLDAEFSLCPRVLVSAGLLWRVLGGTVLWAGGDVGSFDDGYDSK
jgi:hypothetical protein